MLSERDNSQLTEKLDKNAIRTGLFLTQGSVIGAIALFWIGWTTGLEFIYYYFTLTAFVTVMNITGAILVRRNRRVQGVGFLLIGLIALCASLSLGFTDIGLIIGFLSGFLVWQISLLTLERSHVRIATIIGIAFSTLIVAIDLYVPYQRIYLFQLLVAVYIFSPIMFFVFIVIFYQNFDLYDIQTKLTTTTIAVAVIAVGATLTVLTISTRLILTQSNEVEIELRAENVASEISIQFDRQVDRLITLGANQQIEGQISQDTFDLVDFDPEIINIILESRNQIWVNENGQLTTSRHFPFYSRLLNPLSDLLRDYRQSFPETTELFVTNEYGAIVAMSNRKDANKYLYTDTEWWQQISNSEEQIPYIGNPVLLPDGTTLAIPIAVPLRDSNNNFIGVIYSTYSVSHLILSLNINSSSESQTNFSMIVSDQSLLPLIPGQNTIVASPFSSATIDDLFQMNFLQSRTVGRAEGANSSFQNVILTAVSFSSSESEEIYTPASWGVFVSRPLRVIDEVIRVQQRIQVVIGLLVITITAVIAGFLARAVSAPILNLSAVAQRLELGELSARAAVGSLDEIGSLSVAFNQMAEQSQRLVNQLETRVAERTQALETSFRISQTISSLTDKDELVNTVINQLQQSFEYYHVHIYLLDKTKNRLSLVAGSNDPGKQLLEINHHLQMGQGLVGRAALSNLPVLVPDVSRDPQWVANQFLPETKSELAVPISLGDEVLGVIDVQDNKVNKLTEQDEDLLRSIADQVAVALHNSEQIAAAQQRALLESRINSVREKILKTQNVESALKTAIREVGYALGNQKASVHFRAVENPRLQEGHSEQTDTIQKASSKANAAVEENATDNTDSGLNGQLKNNGGPKE